MTMMTRAARGASVYTHADDWPNGPVEESAMPSKAEAKNASADWEPIIDGLLRIRTLEDDWDGEGTVAPDPALVDGAIRLAQGFRAIGTEAAERVLAGVNGTIFFEWHSPAGYLEIEVTSPIDVEWRRVPKGSDTAEFGRV